MISSKLDKIPSTNWQQWWPLSTYKNRHDRFNQVPKRTHEAANNQIEEERRKARDEQ